MGFASFTDVPNAFQVPSTQLILAFRVPHAPLTQYQCTIIKCHEETPYATVENYGILE